MDVFTKKDTAGKELFNVIVIAETPDPIATEEGLKIIPDYTFANTPKIDVLFVPSAYDMYTQVHNQNIVNFIKQDGRESRSAGCPWPG
jgi:transcriptional regulator GlxA family with amidase domain